MPGSYVDILSARPNIPLNAAESIHPVIYPEEYSYYTDCARHMSPAIDTDRCFYFDCPAVLGGQTICWLSVAYQPGLR